MGAWGYGIREDDFVCDVIGAFEDALKTGQSVAEASQRVRTKFAGALEDAGDGPLFWIALAEGQWSYGGVDAHVLHRVREDLDSGRSLAAWSDDPQGLSRRKMALDRFIRRLGRPNRRPKKTGLVVRAPKFRPGDCLSIHLPNGLYGAALVLAADHSHADHGMNLIGVLDYRSAEPPGLDAFGTRRWLDVAWYHYMGFRTVRDRLQVVGTIELLGSDPRDSNTHRRWNGIGEQAIGHLSSP